MEHIKLVIYVLIFVAAIFIVLKYRKNSRKD